MTEAWAGWLERTQAGVSAQRVALAQGRCDGGADEQVPDDLGPLPAALEERVRALLHDNEALTVELHAACAAARRQLELVTAMQHLTVGASFLDTRG